MRKLRYGLLLIASIILTLTAGLRYADAETWQLYTSQQVSPADSTTYYLPLGSVGASWLPAAGAVPLRRYALEEMTLEEYQVMVCGPTGYSSEDLTYTLYQYRAGSPVSTIFTATAPLCTFTSSPLAVPVLIADGDYFVLRVDTPAWATNPTQAAGSLTLRFRDTGGTATTTVVEINTLESQAQQNVGFAVGIFLASMFGMIWLMRKH